jgi:hypothetical protein
MKNNVIIILKCNNHTISPQKLSSRVEKDIEKLIYDCKSEAIYTDFGTNNGTKK